MPKIIKSFANAGMGIIQSFASERNMKIHCLAAVLVVFLGFFLGVSKIELMLLLLSIGFVMSMELMNTAIEATVNLITKDYHELAKLAKNVAAGAVLFAAIIAAIIGLMILLPPLLALF